MCYIYKCNSCNTEFSNKKDLEKHIVDILTGGEYHKFCFLIILETRLADLLQDWDLAG